MNIFDIIIIGIMLYMLAMVILYLNGRKKVEAKLNYNNREGIVYYEYIKLIGGIPNILGGRNGELKMTKDNITLEFNGVDGMKKYKISKNDFINAEIMSKETIENKVSIGKLLCFGVLAFGMKNKKQIIDNYVVINHMVENDKKSIVLELNGGLERSVNQLNLFKK